MSSSIMFQQPVKASQKPPELQLLRVPAQLRKEAGRRAVMLCHRRHFIGPALAMHGHSPPRQPSSFPLYICARTSSRPLHLSGLQLMPGWSAACECPGPLRSDRPPTASLHAHNVMHPDPATYVHQPLPGGQHSPSATVRAAAASHRPCCRCLCRGAPAALPLTSSSEPQALLPDSTCGILLCTFSGRRALVAAMPLIAAPGALSEDAYHC